MDSRHLDELLRKAAVLPTADGPPDMRAVVLGQLQNGKNPWRRDWRRFLLCWVPVGLLLIVLLALAVVSLPHGDHKHAAAPPVFPEEQR